MVLLVDLVVPGPLLVPGVLGLPASKHRISFENVQYMHACAALDSRCFGFIELDDV